MPIEPEAAEPEVAALLGEIDFDPDALHAKYLAERDKRLRTDGNSQYVEVTAEFSRYIDDPYVAPGFARESVFDDVEFAIIGGGFGGLLMGARLREAGFGKIRVVETAGDFGGTWYWNRYPGAMCDVESYCYLPLLEELGYMPKRKYSFAPEILEHCQRIARHYRLYDDALLQTSIRELRWDEDAGRWIVSTNRGDRFRAQYVAMANGPLNRPKLPGLPGINDFKGYTFHTSRWDYRYTGGDNSGGLAGLSDKRVGIIGTGATAVQCIPHLGEWAKELYVFQRTPSSIDVRNNSETDPAWAASLTPGWQQRRMDNFNTLTSGGHQDEDLVQDGLAAEDAERDRQRRGEQAAQPAGFDRHRAEHRRHGLGRMAEGRQQRQRADLARVLEREGERGRAAQRMPDYGRALQPQPVDQGGDGARLGGQVRGHAARPRRIAGTGPVHRHHAVAARERAHGAIVEMRHLAAQAMDHQDGRAASLVAHVQAHALDLDEAAGGRQEGLDAARGAAAEHGQQDEQQRQAAEDDEEEVEVHRALAFFRSCQ